MGKYKKILIVGKNKNFINELTNYLLTAGFRNIESLNNFNNALVRFKNDCFDFVLMDVSSSKMREIYYAYEIRSLKPKTKIFLMIDPEHQKQISEKILKKAKFNCVLKFFVKDNILELF